jgi:hypothetical protein
VPAALSKETLELIPVTMVHNVYLIAARTYEYSRPSFAHMLVKGKAIPLQAETGPEGSRRMRFPYFKTIGT